jgi:hypothetical protein
MVDLLLKVLFAKDMDGILDKKGHLIFYAQRFDNYCGYQALIILLIIIVFSCQVFALIPPLSEQVGVIIEVTVLLIFSTSRSLESSLLSLSLSSYLFKLQT